MTIRTLAYTLVTLETICIVLIIMLLLTPKEVFEASGYTIKIERIK